MKDRLRDAYGTSQAEVSVLRQQQEDLNQGKAKLEGLMNKLSLEQVSRHRFYAYLKAKRENFKLPLHDIIIAVAAYNYNL